MISFLFHATMEMCKNNVENIRVDKFSLTQELIFDHDNQSNKSIH